MKNSSVIKIVIHPCFTAIFGNKLCDPSVSTYSRKLLKDFSKLILKIGCILTGWLYFSRWSEVYCIRSFRTEITYCRFLLFTCWLFLWVCLWAAFPSSSPLKFVLSLHRYHSLQCYYLWQPGKPLHEGYLYILLLVKVDGALYK